jgi:hypothetical protein
VTIERGRGDGADGLVFYAPMGGPGQTGALIFDADGEPVWFRASEKGQATMDLRVQRYRGEPVVTWWYGHVGKGYGVGDGVIADASYREIARVRGANGHRPDLHEFLLTPDGTALVASYAIVRRGPHRVVDGIVQELDVATGELVFEWRSLDHVDPSESHRKPPRKPGQLFDYFHLNSIDVDSDGNLVVSARHTWAVYKLDRRDGRVLWRLGGKKSDFALGEGVRFAWQHDARVTAPGTLTIFDNGAAPKVEPRSRALVVRVDEEARRADLAHAFEDDELATAMGNAQTLPDGSLVVGWGTQPVVSEFAPDGELRFRARFPKGARSYRAFRFDWHARPTTVPAVAVVPGAKHVALAASWNGATEVARWAARAGETPDALRVVATVPRAGFETRIPLDGDFRHAAVEALDATGSALARSRTIALPVT